MKWPTIAAMSAMAPLPDGYRYATLSRPDIPGLIDSIKLWHPDIAVGGGSCYLREEFYTSNIALDGESDGHIFVGLFKRGDELAGMWSWEQEPDALSLYCRLIIVAPAHRDAKLASKVMPLAELAGRAMGAELFFGLAMLKRRFIWIGFGAFLMLIPLAATSTNAAIRRIGAPGWQRLHRLVYVIAICGVVHYWWLVKKDITQPLIYGSVLAALLAFRVVQAWRKRPSASG